jgi:hypothetical protein
MQDEQMDHMDEIIRVASNSYHPAYDDKAWDKMEALLDRHLPQQADKRRPVAFILFLLFIVGSFLVALLYPWNERGDKPTTSQPVAVNAH